MADRRKGVVSQGRGANGRFIKITTFPDALDKGRGGKNAGGYVVVNTDFKTPERAVHNLHRAVNTQILSEPDRRASEIQTILRAAVGGAYNRASTGRLARGIFAKANKVGSPDGKSIETAVVVTALNYRELAFVTNLAGEGYFKQFPVAPYTIFAKGVGDKLLDSTGVHGALTGRKAVKFAKRGGGIGRLKIPRRFAFFTAERQQGRGGGETRVINDQFGPADFSKRVGNVGVDAKKDFFFYPLWVHHPGFEEDVISDVARAEGARFTSETTDKTLLAWSELRAERVPGTRLEPTHDVVSRIIPLPGIGVIAAAKGQVRFSRGRITTE